MWTANRSGSVRVQRDVHDAARHRGNALRRYHCETFGGRTRRRTPVSVTSYQRFFSATDLIRFHDPGREGGGRARRPTRVIDGPYHTRRRSAISHGLCGQRKCVEPRLSHEKITLPVNVVRMENRSV